MKKTLFSVLTISLVSTVAHAFPAQCKVSGLRFEKDNVMLFAQHTAKPRLYAIQNISKNALWLTHEGNGRGADAGWGSQLFSQQWSAILMTRPNFALSCHVSKKNGGIKTVSCQSVIRICQFSSLYSKNPISAGYWVAENLSLPILMNRIHARGFEV